MHLEHRKGLAVLFMTEMWERYSFYALRALLVLYLTAQVSEGGMDWSRKDAINLLGLYLGIAYITPLIGGYLSDNYLGQRRSAMIGALMMAAGHFCMAFNQLYVFYLALSLVALGNGMFKPCLTSILGQMYDDADESQRDSAYSLFYMGINVGGAMAGIISGVLMSTYGFDVAFGAAGVGMVIATLIFWYGKERHLGDAGIAPKKKEKSEKAPLTEVDKNRFGLVGILFLLTVCFIVAWEQMSGSVTIFIQGNVDRSFMGWEIPTPWLAGMNPILIVIMAPVLSALWAYLGDIGKDPFLGKKMGIGFLCVALGYVFLQWASGLERPHWSWIVVNQFLIVLGELCVIPISWAAVSSLAPQAYISRAMALMLAGIGVGSYFAGYIGGMVDDIGEQALFGGLAAFSAVLAVISVSLDGKMLRLSHGAV